MAFILVQFGPSPASVCAYWLNGRMCSGSQVGECVGHNGLEKCKHSCALLSSMGSRIWLGGQREEGYSIMPLP